MAPLFKRKYTEHMLKNAYRAEKQLQAEEQRQRQRQLYDELHSKARKPLTTDD